jgi:uncharacterized damage-inducible protein DinB
MEAIRKHLLKYLEYDVWATERWLSFAKECLTQHHGAQFTVEIEKWLRHNEGCYRAWVGLIIGETIDATDSLEKDFHHRFEQIRDLIKGANLEETRVRVSNNTERTIEDMIHHMLNHATYHRGHLRGLAEQAGISDWPETDYSLFARYPIQDA